ncbi:hypothetical protein [Parvibaculum sp.]|jgi:hypothetical protein|uniref:hypothetical protein n=1 Tax=Parvibaculum sp. TaxID=2024848 RepID=UPI0025E98ADF|nr:hypothetical protein [Parvibaculum sp.]|tara:strand:- start:43306 stop:43467 length:162 start_codon:yes stop_codon:yes gene_type:complete
MAFKPNYRHERAERDRAKAAKAQQKLKEREDKAAIRKEAQTEEGAGADETPED